MKIYEGLDEENVKRFQEINSSPMLILTNEAQEVILICYSLNHIDETKDSSV